MYQFIHRKMLSAPAQGITEKIAYKLLKTVYNLIAKTNDPLVNFRCGGATLKIPFSHNLPFILKAHAQYASNLGRLAKYVQATYSDLTLIDIGANIGDSVFFLKNEIDCPILCIEGDDYFLGILQQNISQFSNVSVEKAYVGQANQKISKEIVRKDGTAHLVDSTGSVPIMSLTSILQKHPKFALAKMLKIDTDGFDCLIIRGAIDFLERAKPIVFFEYDPYFLSEQSDDGISIFEDLKEIGYKAAIVYDNFGDYLLSLQLEQKDLLEELHCYLSGRQGLFYADICVFHAEDIDLFRTIRCQEMAFAKNLKNKSKTNAIS